MEINFNLELFESTYTLLKDNLKTGSDRLSVLKKYSNNNFRNIDFKNLEEELLNNKYKMRPLLKKNLKNNRSIFIPCIRDKIILEILRKDLEKKKKFIKYPNRDKIIANLIKILESEQHYSIIKLDIKKCFDNIPKNFLLKKLKEDREITDKEIHLIKQFLKYQKKGVPQGIGLSNFLAEYFLVEIDKELKKISPKISFYTRYIDDIIIILNKPIKFNEIKEIKENILKVFSKNH
ncbi:MAG: reverse transcriptase domain-containing protein, partial [Fusobacteriaceae bacterium]